VARALAGDLAAIGDIFDRMDGTPVAAADAPPGRPSLQWKDRSSSGRGRRSAPAASQRHRSCESKGGTVPPTSSSRGCKARRITDMRRVAAGA
jgi:hypothetical protein